MNNDAITDERASDRRIPANPAVSADLNARPYHRVGADLDAPTDRGAGPNDYAWFKINCVRNPGRWVDVGLSCLHPPQTYQRRCDFQEGRTRIRRRYPAGVSSCRRSSSRNHYPGESVLGGILLKEDQVFRPGGGCRRNGRNFPAVRASHDAPIDQNGDRRCGQRRPRCVEAVVNQSAPPGPSDRAGPIAVSWIPSPARRPRAPAPPSAALAVSASSRRDAPPPACSHRQCS